MVFVSDRALLLTDYEKVPVDRFLQVERMRPISGEKEDPAGVRSEE